MGPATGGATSTGEGDVVFARHVTSGSYPLPVLSAADAESAYWLTYEAFRIADRLPLLYPGIFSYDGITAPFVEGAASFIVFNYNDILPVACIRDGLNSAFFEATTFWLDCGNIPMPIFLRHSFSRQTVISPPP